MLKRFLIIIVLGLFLASCSSRHVVKTGYYPYPVMKAVPEGYTLTGIASWYGPNFHGKRTANGEVYNMYEHTAASKTLPFNTIVRVINLNNGKSTVVRINDRGPFVKNRIIDLSYAAAKDLGMIGTGTAPVKIVVLKGNGSVVNTANTHTNGYAINTIEKQSIEEIGHRSINTNLNEKIVGIYYTIQFGAFRNLFNAIKLRDRLSHFFKGVVIEKRYIEGEAYYKVVLGLFNSKDEALQYASRYIMPVTTSYIVSKR